MNEKKIYSFHHDSVIEEISCVGETMQGATEQKNKRGAGQNWAVEVSKVNEQTVGDCRTHDWLTEGIRNTLYSSCTPGLVMGKIRNRNLERQPLLQSHRFTSIRLSFAQGCTRVVMPCNPWEKIRIKMLFCKFCVFVYKKVYQESDHRLRTKLFASVQKTTRMIFSKKSEIK